MRSQPGRKVQRSPIIQPVPSLVSILFGYHSRSVRSLREALSIYFYLLLAINPVHTIYDGGGRRVVFTPPYKEGMNSSFKLSPRDGRLRCEVTRGHNSLTFIARFTSRCRLVLIKRDGSNKHFKSRAGRAHLVFACAFHGLHHANSRLHGSSVVTLPVAAKRLPTGGFNSVTNATMFKAWEFISWR